MGVLGDRMIARESEKIFSAHQTLPAETQVLIQQSEAKVCALPERVQVAQDQSRSRVAAVRHWIPNPSFCGGSCSPSRPPPSRLFCALSLELALSEAPLLQQERCWKLFLLFLHMLPFHGPCSGAIVIIPSELGLPHWRKKFGETTRSAVGAENFYGPTNGGLLHRNM